MPGVFRADFAGLAQVRLIQDGDKWVVPVVDIAEAIGYDRQALHQIISREPEMFEGFVNVTLTNPGPQGGSPDITAVTQEGVNLLLVSLSPSRINDEVKRQRVIAFKRWAAKTLTAVQRGKFPEQPSPINLVDLFDLPARLRADAVRKLACEQEEHPCTIYGKINKAKKLAGIPIRSRSDKGKLARPEEAERARAYKAEHPDATGPQIHDALGCNYSVASINRILRN